MDESSVKELQVHEEERMGSAQSSKSSNERLGVEGRETRRTHHRNDEPVPLPRLIGDFQSAPISDGASFGERDVRAPGFVEASDGCRERCVDDVLSNENEADRRNESVLVAWYDFNRGWRSR